MSAANPLWNPWANTHDMLDLYRRRCRQEEVEMTCAAQAAAILTPLVTPGETLLDAGCAGGHYYWSFANRGVPVRYYGLDHTPQMIWLAHEEMCNGKTMLTPAHFQLGNIEDLGLKFDNVICFNTLSFNAHYGPPLVTLLTHARKRILLRECMGDELIVRYAPDSDLDRPMWMYHNQYPVAEVATLMEVHGFKVTRIFDERSGDGVEIVKDIPHQWRILLGERVG